MLVVRIKCPSCEQSYKSPQKNLGHRMRCKRCGKVFRAESSDDGNSTLVEPNSTGAFNVSGSRNVSSFNEKPTFANYPDTVIHRKLGLYLGPITIAMPDVPRARRSLTIQVSMYANHMRARCAHFKISCTSKTFKSKLIKDEFLY